jgi:hypothetical protein
VVTSEPSRGMRLVRRIASAPGAGDEGAGDSSVGGLARPVGSGPASRSEPLSSRPGAGAAPGCCSPLEHGTRACSLHRRERAARAIARKNRRLYGQQEIGRALGASVVADSRRICRNNPLQGKASLYTPSCFCLRAPRRSGRVVEGSGLENRRVKAPGVRIPPPPPG